MPPPCLSSDFVHVYYIYALIPSPSSALDIHIYIYIHIYTAKGEYEKSFAAECNNTTSALFHPPSSTIVPLAHTPPFFLSHSVYLILPP